MLQHILIQDFAVIENTEIEFANGLNIVTGETGAGKSIVIQAISLALGSRADSSFVRHGKERAIIQLQAELDGKEYVITREISANGKNLCRLNGQLVTLGEINEIAHRLADIHGQYDNQLLLDPLQHLRIVDQYRSEEISPCRSAFLEAYNAYKDKRESLRNLLKTQAENARKADFLRFQAEEIQRAALTEREDEALEERITVLENSEKIFSAVENAYSALDGEDPSVLGALGYASQTLGQVAGLTETLTEAHERLESALYDLQDAAELLRDIRDGSAFSQEELDSAIARLNTIEDLKKKYGSTIEEIIEYGSTIEEQLLSIDNFDERRTALEEETAKLRASLMDCAAKLTEVRAASARQLASAIEKELHDLNFKDAKLELRLSPAPSITELGADQCEIYLSTNRGEPMKPLTRVASGGEISRIMLAIKNITAEHDAMPTMIFDEIDTGISGMTASVVGSKLREISREHQIICITHLPQIAACGDDNYKIDKSTTDTETFTQVLHLTHDETVDEIARLMAGESVTDTARQNARELIAASK